MSWKNRISIDPKVLVGKPVIAGTRLAVDFLLDLFGQGWSKEQVLESYPQLQEEDLSAIFAYSAARLKGEELFLTDDGTSG